MHALLDFIPLILFFVAFRMEGIFAATGVLVAATVVQLVIYRMIGKPIPKPMLYSSLIAIVLGILTIALDDPTFVKWKPTAVYWLFAVALLGFNYLSAKPAMQRALGEQLKLPEVIWRRLGNLWAGFFVFCGVLNIYVAYNYELSTWVDFKVFGMTGLLLVFAVLQAFYLARHMPDDDDSNAETDKPQEGT